jgi:hypothetical protein
MKFVCLGYFDDKKWEALSETEQKAFIEECFAYDDVLRKGGQIAGGEALEPPRNAATLRLKRVADLKPFGIRDPGVWLRRSAHLIAPSKDQIVAGSQVPQQCR